jgi:hypothetical protein
MERIINSQSKSRCEQTYVCPFCLQENPRGTRCACIEAGGIKNVDQTVQSRIERLSLMNRQRILAMIEEYEALELRQKEVEPQQFADKTTPPANSQKAISNDSVPRRMIDKISDCLSFSS